MWLLHTTTSELRNFVSDVPRYAILSHVWEATDHSHMFQEIQTIYAQCRTSGKDPRAILTPKVRNFCIFAEGLGYEWVWLDTCCIDKSSSAELSEAINSMCAWYRNAATCYVYLCDVGDRNDPRAPDSEFRRSRWHTRGWTLQELIVPRFVTFVSSDWNVLGTKITLAYVLEEVTRVRWEILVGQQGISSISVAQRFSWMSHRETTRVEDLAYSLLGIFGVHMPIVYGEGLEHAFTRLQKKILKCISDKSIFAWGNLHPDFEAAFEALQWPHQEIIYDHPPWYSEALARSPSKFHLCGDVEEVWYSHSTTVGHEHIWTSQGLVTDFLVSVDYIPCPSSKEHGIYAALLHYERFEEGSNILLFLRMRPADVAQSPTVLPLATVGYKFGREGSPDERFYRGALLSCRSWYGQSLLDFRLIRICVESGKTLRARQARLGADRDVLPSLPFSAPTAKPRSFYIPYWCVECLELVNGFVLPERRVAANGDGHRIDSSTMDYVHPTPLEIKFTNVNARATLTFRFGPGCSCQGLGRAPWWMEVYLSDLERVQEASDADSKYPSHIVSTHGRRLRVVSSTHVPCACMGEAAACRGVMCLADIRYCDPMVFKDGARRTVNVECRFTDMDLSVSQYEDVDNSKHPIHIAMMIDLVGFNDEKADTAAHTSFVPKSTNDATRFTAAPTETIFFELPTSGDSPVLGHPSEAPEWILGYTPGLRALRSRTCQRMSDSVSIAIRYLVDWFTAGPDYSYGSLV